MHQVQRTRPATAADFHRLADLAHERGLQLFRDGQRWYCSSASDRGGCHYVTGFSCDCPGFIAHQRCTHHALLLERLGWLPEVEEPAPAGCPDCSGCGVVVYRTFEERCDTCGGSGLKVDRRLQGQPAIRPVAEIMGDAQTLSAA